MNTIIWETKVTKYYEDFNLYLNVGMCKKYNPQEINKDLEEFRDYLLAKYVLKK